MDWKLALSVAGLLWGVALTLWTRYVAAQAASKKEIQEVHDEAGRLTVRVAQLETQISQMPGASAVHSLALSISSMEGDMKELTAKIDPIARSLRRMEDYLLSEKSGK